MQAYDHEVRHDVYWNMPGILPAGLPGSTIAADLFNSEYQGVHQVCQITSGEWIWMLVHTPIPGYYRVYLQLTAWHANEDDITCAYLRVAAMSLSQTVVGSKLPGARKREGLRYAFPFFQRGFLGFPFSNCGAIPQFRYPLAQRIRHTKFSGHLKHNSWQSPRSPLQ